MNLRTFLWSGVLFALVLSSRALGAGYQLPENTPGDRMLAGYFRTETASISTQCLAEIKSLADWDAQRGRFREELQEMLGLSPLPAKTDLKAVVTGRVERDDFVVENLHFQSKPGLYVTANLYLPKNVSRPSPTILYLSGHGPVISNNVSYGNKVSYQHHGAWFARNGYACLVIDTLQLGEILGLHHGTYREGMWWWNSRGYTPAGVEAWNCLRALDYLETRQEVDRTRFGATGRSGGGAYSWWIAALDDRIKAVAPVAGITDLEDHVVNGCVEGHCDCMFTVNTYRWDYPQVAALVAPRPLLLVNTDADSIFPLDGVVRTHAHLRRIYDLHRAPDKLGLVIAPGPHKDTQDLQVPVFRWFNKYLKNEDPVIEMAAMKMFRPEQLKVFATLPADSINTNIQETFVPTAPVPVVPKSQEEWAGQRDAWLAALKAKSFAGWPEESTPLKLEKKYSAIREGMKFEVFEFDSEPGVKLRLFCMSPARQRRAMLVSLHIKDDDGWDPMKSAWRLQAPEVLGDEPAGDAKSQHPEDSRWFAAMLEMMKQDKSLIAYVAPRGIGPSASSADFRRQVQIRRRYMLLGQTLDSMRVWDIRRACQAVREIQGKRAFTPIALESAGPMGVNAVYASLFEPGIGRLILNSPSRTHRDGPDYLNVLRVLDVPQAVAMAAERSAVTIFGEDTSVRDYSETVAKKLGWREDRFKVSKPSASAAR